MTPTEPGAWYRQPTLVATAGMVLLCLALELAGDPARLGLRYEREAILAGGWWRLLSGHLVHLGWAHTGMNLLALALLAALFGADLRARVWLAVWLGSSAAISAGMYYLMPHLEWYVGLSGTLHGLFAAAATARCLRRERDGWWLLGALLAKLAWEQFVGPTPFTAESTGGPVIVNAHLYGAIGGGLVTLAFAKSIHRRSNP